MMPNRLALLACPLLLALAGCGPDTARSLGFTRDPPDEFQVTTRAPLSVPPRLGELPPPTPGAQRPQEARSAAGLFAPGTTAAAPSPAERALVARAGGPVDDNIRRRVDEESLRLDRPDRSVVDRLMFWRDQPPPGITVDPTREAQRLRENAALGRESTEGDTPIAQPGQNQDRGLLNRLFGL
jgi:hypothetical protein